jgi:hypothetical protein
MRDAIPGASPAYAESSGKVCPGTKSTVWGDGATVDMKSISDSRFADSTVLRLIQSSLDDVRGYLKDNLEWLNVVAYALRNGTLKIATSPLCRDVTRHNFRSTKVCLYISQ